MKYNSSTYSLKIWLTSVAVAPLLYIIIITNKHALHLPTAEDISGSIVMYLYLAFFQLIFSLLTAVLFILIVKAIVDFCTNARLWKPLIFITGILLTLGTFRLVFSGVFNSSDKFFYLMLCNCFCIGGGTWFYKIKVLRSRPAQVHKCSED